MNKLKYAGCFIILLIIFLSTRKVVDDDDNASDDELKRSRNVSHSLNHFLCCLSRICPLPLSYPKAVGGGELPKIYGAIRSENAVAS